MKILLYCRPGTIREPSETTGLLSALDGSGLDYALNEGFAADVEAMTGRPVGAEKRYDPFAGDFSGSDAVLSYGGDGTFLECAKLIGMAGVPVLGINSGRLGFLANVAKDDLGDALDALREKRYIIKESPLLEVEGDCLPGPLYAFNELSVQRSGTGMIAVETYLGGEMVATYWGDGVILATPAGSTAYALSVGGPVVAPDCDCFVLAPIAPHNLTMRPVVLPDSTQTELRVMSRDHRITVSADGDYHEVPDGAVLKVVKSKKTVFLVRLQNISFYDTLRNKMLWGLDKRDEAAG